MIEQIAFMTDSMDLAIEEKSTRMGVTPESWTRDTVVAVNLFKSWHEDSLISVFKVDLAFNYGILVAPSMEFELIELLRGRSCQFEEDDCPTEAGLAHVGYHVKDAWEDADSLSSALRYWRSKGFRVLQVAQTVSHTGTDKRYRYAFIDTRRLYGVPLKIIQRYTGDPPPPCEPIDHFLFGEVAGEFQWLRER